MVELWSNQIKLGLERLLIDSPINQTWRFSPIFRTLHITLNDPKNFTDISKKFNDLFCQVS